MANPSTEDTAFSTPEIEDRIEYRPISRLALLALFLGSFSWLSLVNPLFAVLGGAAIVVGVMVVRTISVEKETGRALAIVAILVASLFAAWGPARHFSRRAALFERAHQFADDWLKLVDQGNFQEAHQLTMSYVAREDPQNLEKYYAPPIMDGAGMFGQPPYIEMVSFFERPPLDKITGMQGGFEFEFIEGLAVYSPANFPEEIGLLYRFAPREGDKSKALNAIVRLERQRDGRTAMWNVTEVTAYGPEDRPAQNLAERRTW